MKCIVMKNMMKSIIVMTTTNVNYLSHITILVINMTSFPYTVLTMSNTDASDKNKDLTFENPNLQAVGIKKGIFHSLNYLTFMNTVFPRKSTSFERVSPLNEHLS